MKSYGKFDQYVSLAVKDQEKASEIVARSFYKILKKNGFSDSQIINVASNVLGCLIEALEGYRTRKEARRGRRSRQTPRKNAKTGETDVPTSTILDTDE